MSTRPPCVISLMQIFTRSATTSTPNAKTAAAARKQAPVVAENVLFDKGLR